MRFINRGGKLSVGIFYDQNISKKIYINVNISFFLQTLSRAQSQAPPTPTGPPPASDVCVGVFLSYSYESGRILLLIQSSDPPTSAPASDDRTVQIWDARVAECVKTLKGHADMNSLLTRYPAPLHLNVDKELESIQILSNKKNDDEVFTKLGSDKDKCKEATEKAKKSVSRNELLKPANGENYYRGGGPGRGRGHGGR
ncbi:nuclear RNA binding protein [Striga asiatica]|uniref:Nuclear RNA binding protein n=1 Tax=Striga asiatica TaxID=4170 RepID=A0A5A7QUP6_STRAF|nr:nuclear RNA binding protein [Striga asiatica]